MMRASMAALQMASPTARRLAAAIHAVLTLEDYEAPQGATSATITATVSHPVYGTPLVITLDNGATIIIEVGATSGVSTAFSIEPGGEPFVVAVESVSGGTYTSLDTSDTATVTPGEEVEPVLTYFGSSIQSVSGSIPKADLLAFVPEGVDPSLVVVDCEAVGGGAGGIATGISGTASNGGAPGKVEVLRVAYEDLPEKVSFFIGAGGPSGTTYGREGGETRIAGIVTAGTSGWDSVTPKDRPTGPGAGSQDYTNTSELRRGGHSNASIPSLMLEGGSGASNTTPGHGRDATTPFQHGSGGSAVGGSTPGGNGGWPGGGGGRGHPFYGGGAGGGGVVRFHVYAYVPAEPQEEEGDDEG